MTAPHAKTLEHLTILLGTGSPDAELRRAAAFSSVYADLRQIARAQLAEERVDHTLQPTALVHEAWLRLFGTERPFASLKEFFAAAANTMRRVLVDHARARGRAKRGGARRKIALDALELATAADGADLLAVDEAIEALSLRDARLAEQVRLRLYAGLGDVEIGAALGVSERTVRRDWLLARAFLQRELRSGA